MMFGSRIRKGNNFNEEVRRALKRVDQVADAVKSTLGPRGRNVAIDKKFGAPTAIRDGGEGVMRSAVQSAVSIAGLLLTTEALIADIPEANSDGGGMLGGEMDF